MEHIQTNPKRKFSFRTLYGIVFLILTVLLALLFLLQALSVYFDGMENKENARESARAQAQADGLDEEATRIAVAVAAEKVPIYSREIVSHRLKQLLPYLFVWIAALLGTVPVTLLTRAASPKKKRDPDLMLSDRLRKGRSQMASVAAPNDLEKQTIYKQACIELQSVRSHARMLWLVGTGCAVLCAGFPLLYFLDFSHFPNENLNKEVLHAMLFALPFLAVLFAGLFLYTRLRVKLQKKELAAIKAAVAAGDLQTENEFTNKSRHAPYIVILRFALLLIAIALLLIGIWNGSMHDVFVKATNICTECIGLG